MTMLVKAYQVHNWLFIQQQKVLLYLKITSSSVMWHYLELHQDTYSSMDKRASVLLFVTQGLLLSLRE
ncbi:hypothetical protein D3C85_1531210 [compost metagenome]